MELNWKGESEQRGSESESFFVSTIVREVTVNNEF